LTLLSCRSLTMICLTDISVMMMPRIASPAPVTALPRGPGPPTGRRRLDPRRPCLPRGGRPSPPPRCEEREIDGAGSCRGKSAQARSPGPTASCSRGNTKTTRGTVQVEQRGSEGRLGEGAGVRWVVA
jgi:hypothetical protein